MSAIDIWPAQKLAVIRIGREDDLYMSEPRAEELCADIDAANANDAVRSIVFTGSTPDTFIRHYSLDELIRLSSKLQKSRAEIREDSEINPNFFDRACAAVERGHKPTIAAINGHCMGGGLEFALACDIRIGRQGDFMIGLPEAQVGLLPGGGGTQRLPRLIGYARAVELMFTGGVVDPDEAAWMGILSRAVEDPLSDALALGARISAQTPHAVGSIKRLAREGWLNGLDESLKLERNLFMRLVQTPMAIALMTEQIEINKKRNLA